MNNDLIFRSKLEGMHLFVSPGEKPDKETVGWNRAIDYVINNAPAVDAEVVRHGRWISENIRKKSYLRQCSVCNKIAYFCGTGCSYKYCPNCGTKMDGDVNAAD